MTLPAYRAPETWDRAYLLDVAAAGQSDGYAVCRDSTLVEALCKLIGDLEHELRDQSGNACRGCGDDIPADRTSCGALECGLRSLDDMFPAHRGR